MRDWLKAEGLTPGELDSYEVTYAHSSGHGYVTLRFWPNNYGWDAIVRTNTGRHAGFGVNLGTCQTLAQMEQVLKTFRLFDRAYYVDTHGQRVEPVEPLVERSNGG